MSFEADLRSHLLDASVTAYVGERIHRLFRPAGGTLPVITYQRVAGVPQTDLDGDDGNLLNVKMQVDVWSLDYDQAKLIAEAVRIRMQTAAITFSSILELDQDVYEDDTKEFRVVMDFSCWYRTA